MLLPLLGMAALVLVASAHLEQRAVENGLQLRVRVLASSTEVALRNMIADLTVMRSTKAIDIDHPEGFPALAERYLAAHREWQAVALQNADGAVLSVAGPHAAELARALTNVVGQATSAASVRIVGRSGGGKPMVGVFVPVRRGDGATGWLVAAEAAEDFLPPASGGEWPQGDVVALLDRQHRVLAAIDPDLVDHNWPYAPAGSSLAAGTPMTLRALLAGQPAYSVIAPLTATPWDFALVVPASVVEAPLRLSRLLFIGLAGLLVLTVVPSLLLGEWLGRRIESLAAVADAVAHESVLPASPPTRLKEIGLVQAELVHAAGLVRERSATMERLHAMERNLKRLQQLESVGQLAAAIAHDFGSHLFAIRGRLELIRDATRDSPRVQELADPALQVAGEAVHLVHELSSLATHKSAGLARVNINLVLQEMEALLRHLAGQAIRIEIHRAKNLWDCRFAPIRLQSALVNLVTNARDAMPAGGSIRIETRNLTVAEHDNPDCHRLPVGSYVSLAVADTGTGISPESMAHIFEPFFTTKPEGHGTGIGLSTLSASVRAAGGRVLVASTLGVGSEFTIILPEMVATANNSITAAVPGI